MVDIFSSSVINTFPELVSRVNFLNKMYQCLLCFQLSHKTRKLVVVSEKDSGKSSWSQILMGIIPQSKVAVLTKEKHFGASMICDDTQLLHKDEWNADVMTSDLLKTLLQGGHFLQSIKHGTPRMQEMNAGVYITCNILPNFGAEHENVKRRFYIYQTKSLPNKNVDARRWVKENAFECIVWAMTVINSNIQWVDPEERFYEKDRKTRVFAMPSVRVSDTDLRNIQDATLEKEDSVCDDRASDGVNEFAQIFLDNGKNISIYI